MNEQTPALAVTDGAVRANSRDIAASFEKEHRDVLRAIDNLILQEPDLGLRNFAQTPYVEPQNGQTYRAIDMDRDGFTLLAMGFTGPKALKWKLAYIEAFNRMEAELRARPDPILALSDPAALRALLLENVEERLRLAEKVAADAPKVAALDLLSASTGSMTFTQASKLLSMKVADMTRWMDAHRWIYRQNGSWLAYKEQIQNGRLEYKEANYTDQNTGMKCTKPYCHITPKGLAKLATVFGAVLNSAA